MFILLVRPGITGIEKVSIAIAKRYNTKAILRIFV
jgi:hypothetical protein